MRKELIRYHHSDIIKVTFICEGALKSRAVGTPIKTIDRRQDFVNDLFEDCQIEVETGWKSK